MKKYVACIRQITYLGFLLVIGFAVKTFQEAIPDQMYVTVGQKVSYEFDVPVSVVLKEDSAEVFENTAARAAFDNTYASYTVTCKLFGIFPVKDVEVTLVDAKTIYASGTPIGIYAQTDGILVIGTGKVEDASGTEQCPAQNLIKSGDYIVSVNGESVTEKEQLVEKINEGAGAKEIIGVRRNGEYIEVSVEPVEGADGSYMLGLWVRDDLAGIGTLTYFSGDGSFGALGHAVSDSDTGTRLEMESGYIYATNIVGIRKGENGNPGELSGIINYSSDNRLGTLSENTDLGIYGILDGNLDRLGSSICCEIAYKQDIELGKAYILSALDGEMKQYEIEIEGLDYGGLEENKGILFRVTDEELLELTGGIVQGMSGSPIIQNGKLIGAVTHVFVSDASRGYGIFIEKMLQ